MTTKIQLFHSQTPGNVPPEGLLVGEVAYNVADNFQFVGYGGDVNYDVYGNPLPDLPPPGMGWKTFVTGGGDQPGPPGPGVPEGGDTGQILSKLSDGDYVTGWVDNYGPAQPSTVGVVYGLTSTSLGGNSSVFLGFQAGTNIGSGLRNVAIGFQAGLNQNDVDDNVVIGHQAAWNIDGDGNVVIGSEALGNEPGGPATGNVAVGYKAGYNLTEGDGNIFIGYESGMGVRLGAANVIIGAYPGATDWVGNVALSDGYGDLKFLANQAGAWSTDGQDFGEPDFVLTSQGDGLPPVWKEIPLGFVSKIVAGENVWIDPPEGTGIVTVNAAGGGGGGGITALRANTGLLVSGGGTNPITTSGGLEVDFTKVVATSLYNTDGALLVGSATGPVKLNVGTTGQVLQVQQNGSIAWATIPSASPATPTSLGLVYGSTTTNGTYYGYGAGQSVTGANNTLIGESAGSGVGAGTDNTFIGAYTGYAGLSDSVALATGAGAVRFFANAAGAWSLSGDAQFGEAGQVLSSQGQNSPPKWVTPVNAPIQDVNDGPGISTSIDGTTLTISNEGVLSVTANAPIQAVNTTGNIVLSAPNVLSDLQQGTGITISGTGNSRTISNAGVVTLQNGTNTVATQVSPGVWKIDASGGGGGGTITSLTEGAGINITDPLGPNPTITNAGVISIQDGANVVPDVNAGNVTLSLQNIVFDVTAGAGITVGGTAEHPTIANSGVISLQDGTGTTVQNVGNGVWQVNATGTAGVTKIIAGTNVSITPVTGTGEVTINAAGGGGGGSITEIKSGDGITVNSGTGPITTITNNGVLSLTAGTNTTITGTANNPIINAVGSINNLKEGKGINILNPTGPEPTIENTGVIGLVAGANVTIQETGAGTGVFSISSSGGGGGGAVASVTGSGAGIDVTPTTGAVVVKNTGVTSLTGTDGNLTVSGSTGAVTLNIGANVLTNVTAGNSGITVAGTGNTRSISAAVAGLTAGAGINLTNNSGNFTIKNTGVLGLTAGTNVTITETTPGSGNFTISSTGGGGGADGTVKSITAGYGLTGGTITTSGTLTIDSNICVTYPQYKDQKPGSILYTDNTGVDWSGGILTAGTSRFNKKVLSGYSDITGTWVEWDDAPVGGFQSSASIVYHKALVPVVHVNEYYFDVDEYWLNDWLAQKGGTKGSLLYVSRAHTVGFANGEISGVAPGTPGQYLGLNADSIPTWNSFTLTDFSVTAPITKTVDPLTPTVPKIGFDVNTTTLTKYVPKSAFSLAGQLLYGTGAGAYSALNIGSNGQVLTVSNSGTLVWADPPTPGADINLTPADDSIVMTPNPITGTGTIGVNPGKYIPTVTIQNKGDMIYGDEDGNPARLAAGTAGQMIVMSGTGVPVWVTDLDSGSY